MILTTHRRMMTIDGLGAVSMMHAGRLGVVGCTYLLRATFDADDQGFADGQVLDTVAEGVQDGQLTVVELDGTLAIVGNECAFTAQGTPVWGDLGLVGEALGSGGFARVLGRGLIATFNLSTWEEMGIGWHTAAAVVDPGSAEHGIQAHTTDGQIDNQDGVIIATGLSLSTDYEVALVLGGYDANGVPWHTGEAAASYLYGAGLFIEVAGTWQLLWRDEAGNTATLYALLSILDGAGTIDNFRVPDEDFSAVLQPLAKSTFTAANGTSLDAITPEVGGAWTEQNGDWDILTNKARPTGGEPGGFAWVASIDSEVSDCLIRDTVNDGGVASTYGIGIIARLTDAANCWLIAPSVVADTFDITELVAGGSTVRATTSVTVDPSTDYDVVAILDGQTITGFLDGGSRITYGSAAFQETETEHGLRSRRAGNIHDNFHVHARTAAVYDTTLDLC